MDLSLEKLGEQLKGDSRSGLQRQEYLVATSPIVLYTRRLGEDHAVTFVSLGVKASWGYEPHEFLGDSRFWADHIHPDDVPRFREGLSSVLQLGRYSHEYRFRAKGGKYRWTHDEAWLVGDPAGRPLEIAGCCIDITKRKLAEIALEESNARLRLAFDGTTDLQALYRVEPDGRLVLETANQALIKRFDVSARKNLADFIGSSFEEVLLATGLTADEAAQRRSLYQKVVQDRTPIRFVSPQTSRGDVVELALYPVIDQQGVCTHVLSNGRIITERLRTEAALRESLERYGLVLEATYDGIFDRDIASGRYYCSPRYKQILGESDGDELPSDLESLFERIHPDDRGRYRSEFDGYRRDKAVERFSAEFRLRHKDGTYRWVVSRGRLLRDAEGKLTRVVGAVRDVTERYRAAEKLAASEKRLRDILDSQFGFVGLYGLDGTVLYVNRAPLEAAGIQAEDVLGKPLWETHWWSHNSEEQALLRSKMAEAAGGERVRFESRRLTKGGQHIIVDATFGPLRDQHGAICNIVGFGVDVTRRKEAEAELLRAKQVAEAASRAKSDFLANMSHEIRTPMNGIIGLSEVLLDSELNPEQREYLGLVKTSAESLLKIITDILDMAKIQSGKYVLHSKEFWLREVVESATGKFAGAANKKNLELLSHVETALPTVVLGDLDCLCQVLGNVLDNAIKFTAAGEIALRVEVSPENPALLHFSVRDTGIGVSSEVQQTIFEPFSQVDASSRRQYGGAGLGLAISTQLVEMMGGRMWVESDGQLGSTFHFTVLLPASTSDPLPSKEAAGRHLPAASGSTDFKQERRRQPRFAANEVASLEVVRPFSPFPLDVRVLNESKSGLKLRTSESIDPGTLVRVHINGRPVMAEVRYCVPIGREFHAGIKLQDAE